MTVPLVRNMTAGDVAQEGYAACMTGQPLFINGFANRAMIQLGRYQLPWPQRLP